MRAAAGIDITHLDAHMGTAQMPEFTAIYRKLGQDYRLPVLLVKDLAGYNPASYAGDIDTARYDAEIAEAQSGRRAGLRHRARNAMGAQDRCRNRLP